MTTGPSTYHSSVHCPYLGALDSLPLESYPYAQGCEVELRSPLQSPRAEGTALLLIK